MTVHLRLSKVEGKIHKTTRNSSKSNSKNKPVQCPFVS